MSTREKLLLVGNNAPKNVVDELVKKGYKPIPCSIDEFVSSEPYVEIFRDRQEQAISNAELLKRADIVVVQSCSADDLSGTSVSDNVLRLNLMLHTLKHYGATQVTAVVPFSAFERQDVRKRKDRFPSIAIDMFAKNLAFNGADRVITTAPHSKDAQGYWEKYFGENYRVIESADIFASSVRDMVMNSLKPVIGAPDGGNKPTDMAQIEARKLIEYVYGSFDESKMFRITKDHIGVNDTVIMGFEGDVVGQHAVILDDMSDTCGTTLNAARKLKEQGAVTVDACLGHGILSGNALEKLLTAKDANGQPVISQLLVSDSIDISQKLARLAKKYPDELNLEHRVKVVSAGGFIGRSLEAFPAVFKPSKFQAALAQLSELEKGKGK